MMFAVISAWRRCSFALYLKLFVGCLVCIVCACWRVVVSDSFALYLSYCVVFLFCFSSSGVPCVAGFSGVSVVGSSCVVL